MVTSLSITILRADRYREHQENQERHSENRRRADANARLHLTASRSSRVEVEVDRSTRMRRSAYKRAGVVKTIAQLFRQTVVGLPVSRTRGASRRTR